MIFSDNYTESQLPTILVADDMAISRKLLNTLLSPRYNVVEAKNGLEVLDLLKNSNVEISCILLDMLMPVVDGIKVLDFMRENNLLDMIPVIVITAMSSAAGKISCYEAGASEIIEKPYDPKILINRIDNLLKLSARLRSARAAESDGGGSAPFLSAVLDSLPQAVFIFDNATGKISYCNSAFMTLPGVSGNPVGQSVRDAIPGAGTEIAAAAANFLSSRVQIPLFMELGGRRFSFVFNAVLDGNGAIAGIIGTAVELSKENIL